VRQPVRQVPIGGPRSGMTTGASSAGGESIAAWLSTSATKTELM
jgi:hypothetical protein